MTNVLTVVSRTRAGWRRRMWRLRATGTRVLAPVILALLVGVDLAQATPMEVAAAAEDKTEGAANAAAQAPSTVEDQAQAAISAVRKKREAAVASIDHEESEAKAAIQSRRDHFKPEGEAELKKQALRVTIVAATTVMLVFLGT